MESHTMTVMDEKLVRRVDPILLLQAVILWIIFLPLIIIWFIFGYAYRVLGRFLDFMDQIDVKRWYWVKR